MDLTGLLYVIAAMLIALTLHEFAHALAADLLGDRTARNDGRLSLNPAVHIDPFTTLLLPAMLILLQSPVIFGAARPVPFNPWAVKYGKYGSALIAAAGPAMNLLLALAFALALSLGHQYLPASVQTFFVANISINLGFMIFNLIPIPPLDGSRILYAFAPRGVRDAMDNIERSGLVVVFLLLLVAGPLIYPFMGAAIDGIMKVIVR